MSDSRFFVELRAEMQDEGTLVGHAAVFNQHASLPYGYETLAPTAFDNVLASAPDVRALINHDPSKLLARTTNGSLRLGTDAEGLTFSMDMPDTTYANDLRELVRTGLVTGMSFGFIPGADEWTSAPDGRQLRTHTSIKSLLDVSPVTFPAYSGTNVALRSITFTPRPPNGRSRLIKARHALRFPKGDA